MKEERLYIVGYMACGKTTFGKALAAATGWEFVDLDHQIETREGKTISEIIKHDGEEKFRRLESAVLKETASLKRTVISCGGGTPCWRDNMDFMTLHGLTLWLIASPERITERIIEAGDTRPLASGKSADELKVFVKQHLLRRQPYYCRALMRHSGENLETPGEVSAAVESFLTHMHDSDFNIYFS